MGGTRNQRAEDKMGEKNCWLIDAIIIERATSKVLSALSLILIVVLIIVLFLFA